MNATELEMAKALEESKFRFFVTFTIRYRNAWRLRPPNVCIRERNTVTTQNTCTAFLKFLALVSVPILVL